MNETSSTQVGPKGKKPSIGRIVIYTSADGKVAPALVNRVYDNEASERCDLTVFCNGYVDHVFAVRQGAEAGCWNWPELV